jgi:uncharacterized membrane protein required for colicin V production
VWVLGAVDPTSKLLGFLGPVDIVLTLLLVTGLVIGFWTGLIWQLVCFASIVACFYASYVYHPIVADWIGGGASESARRIGSAIGVFIAALLVCYLLSFLFRRLINAIRPQLADRIMGGIFGLLVTGLLAGVVGFFVLQYSQEGGTARRYIEDSKAATAMATVARAFISVLPAEVRERIVQPPGGEQLRAEPESGAARKPS